MNYEILQEKITVIYFSFGALMLLTVLAGMIVLGVYFGKQAGGKTGKMRRFLCLIPTVAAILISVAGFVFNMGWYRFMMIFLLVPV